MADLVQTIAGPAGLFFDPSNLTDSGWQQEQSARQSLERWCHACGLSACYGFGVSLKDDGVWACSDSDCRASAEAEIAHRRSSPPPAKTLTPAFHKAPDLFGEAA